MRWRGWRSTVSEVSNTPSGPPIDIAPTIDALCEAFGFDKRDVTQIIFEPSLLTFTLLDHNEHGRPYIQGERIATSERVYRVTT